MARREIPQEWRVLMDRRGIPSARRLAERAGYSHVTALRVIFDEGTDLTEETLQKTADALGVDYDVVYAMVGKQVKGAGPWKPVPEAARLTFEQRDALDQLIRTMVEPAPRGIYRGKGSPEDYDLAADTSHGPAEGQLWDEEVEASQDV